MGKDDESRERPSFLDRVMEPLVDAIDSRLPADKRYDPQGNWSYDWCRFRRRERCYFPAELDEEASRKEGYAVWVPLDRGRCLRPTWDEQRECPVGEPGPHSGEANSLLDATIAYEDGGQRGGIPSETPDPRRPAPALHQRHPSEGDADPSSLDISDQLSRLARLHAEGSLSDQEFAQAKATVLGKPVATTTEAATSPRPCDHRDSTSRTFCTTCGADL